MQRYAVRRLLQAVPILLGITFISFAIIRLAPGNPVRLLIPPEQMTPENILRLENALGLNDPVLVAYGKWLWQVLHGNLGNSFVDGASVLTKVTALIPNTLRLTVIAFLIGEGLAILLGVLSATRRHSALDHGLTVMSFFGISIPGFWLAMMLILLFSLTLGWLPPSGLTPVGVDNPTLWDYAKHMLMPVFVLAFGSIAGTSRYVRSSLQEVLRQDFVRTARAKGLPERRIVYKHALKNALLPVVTIWGLALPSLIAGAFTVEYVFGLPGMGRLLVESISARDFPVIMGINLITSTLTILFGLAADLAYSLVDPRITFS